MAKNEDEVGEYKRPDAVLAFEIYDDEISKKEAHLATIKGDMSEPYRRIKEEANFPKSVLSFIIKLDNMEEVKRDHFLLALSEGLKARDLFLPSDLVTMMQGQESGTSAIPTGKPDTSLLVDDEDEDLAPVEAFTEATEEELSKQAGRAAKTSRSKKPSITSISPLN